MKKAVRAPRLSPQTRSIRKFLPVIAAFLIGVFVTSLGFMAVARADSSQMIYACVSKKDKPLKLVDDPSECKKPDQVVSWNKEGPQGPMGPQGPAGNAGADAVYFGLPFVCSNCNLEPIASRFIDKDFSYALLSGVSLTNSDIHGVNFSHAIISGNLSGSNLSGGNLSDAKVTGIDLNLSNLTNVNFTNTNLQSVNGLKNSTITNAIWKNTICPDGTNSDNNGNTCEGHF